MAKAILILLFSLPLWADELTDELKDYPNPIKCYPILEDEQGTIVRGSPVILYWIKLQEITDKLVFLTMQGDKFVVPSDSYLCEQ
jgi:hypothetical protein